jgi:hypothetical protein
MLGELWDILPHARVPFDRRVKVVLGHPVRFGVLQLLLLRDQVDGEQGPVRMHWQHAEDPANARSTHLRSINLGVYGDWVPVAVSSRGTVLFNVEAPAWPMTVAA